MSDMVESVDDALMDESRLAALDSHSSANSTASFIASKRVTKLSPYDKKYSLLSPFSMLRTSSFIPDT
jgi:hypothetical protein